MCAVRARPFSRQWRGQDAPIEVTLGVEVVARNQEQHVGRQAQHLRGPQHAVGIKLRGEEPFQGGRAELAPDVVEENPRPPLAQG